MSESDLLQQLANSPLMEIFPEAKLTMRDRLPINYILTNQVITIQKSILNIRYSSEEIKEAIQGFVAMIPDALKDPQFDEEIEKARQLIPVDARPNFCGVVATPKYCREKGIPLFQYVESFDYFRVLHACFNLLMRRNMLLKIQPKEIFTGIRARGEDKYEPETDEL